MEKTQKCPSTPVKGCVSNRRTSFQNKLTHTPVKECPSTPVKKKSISKRTTSPTKVVRPGMLGVQPPSIGCILKNNATFKGETLFGVSLYISKTPAEVLNHLPLDVEACYTLKCEQGSPIDLGEHLQVNEGEKTHIVLTPPVFDRLNNTPIQE